MKMQAVNELLKAVEENGLVTTLYGVFGKSVKVNVPFSQRACETSIDELDFSVRANNAMKRAGIFTIGEVIDMIANDELARVRNLGKRTENEIKTRVLVFGYERLTEAEKKSFFYETLEANVAHI
jgi:DNA-directed RNA polymerase subunit alpha